MTFEENNIYHIYNRGNNRQLIFFKDENYLFFLKKINKELTPYCKVLAYCLMPNHFHLMIFVLPAALRLTTSSGQTKGTSSGQTKGMQVLARKIGTLLSSYTRAINIQENRTGSLFQQKTKAKCIDGNDYAKTCFHYIHQNPLKARLVHKMEDWEYSSFKDYVGLREETLIDKEEALQFIEVPEDFSLLYKESYEVIPHHKLPFIR